jgi:hypothetical protein
VGIGAAGSEFARFVAISIDGRDGPAVALLGSRSGLLVGAASVGACTSPIVVDFAMFPMGGRVGSANVTCGSASGTIDGSAGTSRGTSLSGNAG